MHAVPFSNEQAEHKAVIGKINGKARQTPRATDNLSTGGQMQSTLPKSFGAGR